MRAQFRAVVLQDRLQPFALLLGLAAVAQQFAFQRGMRACIGPPLQRDVDLTLHVREFLQLGDVHVLEIFDLHETNPPLEPL